jgi:hypothetical protein
MAEIHSDAADTAMTIGRRIVASMEMIHATGMAVT